MISYVATFHTHLGALLTYRSLQKAELDAQMSPVPRKLSSSCGTCVFYEARAPQLELMAEEVEGVYEIQGKEYKLLYKNN